MYKVFTFRYNLFTLSSGVKQNVPKVSYLSYLDVWMVTCLVFVNLCMFEFILVTVLVKMELASLGNKVLKNQEGAHFETSQEL